LPFLNLRLKVESHGWIFGSKGTDFMVAARIRAVWPELPDPEHWLATLERSRGTNWHTNFGPIVREFEGRLLTLFGADEEVAVTASNATSGLSACLIAHRIRGPVLCPAFTFQATACAILGAGCAPIILDVDPDTGIPSADGLDDAFAQTGAKAAMLVAPYGMLANFDRHAEICRKHEARLIIDNAAGLGIPRKLKFNVLAHVDEVFSLHATKPFGIGEGGVIFTAKENENSIRSALNFGLLSHSATGNDARPHWGINGKMTEIAGAIGLAVAEKIESRIAARQQMAKEWISALSDMAVRIYCDKPENSAWQVFPIIMPDEGRLIRFVEAMQTQGVELRRYYFPSLGACAGMQQIGLSRYAQALCERVVVLPIRSFMPHDQRMELMQTARNCLHGVLG
jgi:dTDP-4-amino-4,6-dideoxygalactose transaminase